MASYADFNRALSKGTSQSTSTSKKLVEPFNRLKNRANLFRRKNYSSQIHINSSNSDQSVPSARSTENVDGFYLKRSNSMICPQQRLQSLLQSNLSGTNSHSHHRNSICFELAGCSTDESSTDDYQLSKSSFNRYSSRAICSRMSHIDEHESMPSVEMSATDTAGSVLPSHLNEEEEEEAGTATTVVATAEEQEQRSDVTLPSPARKGKESATVNELISSSHLSSSSSASTVLLRDHAEVIRTRRQCHSSLSLLQQHRTLSSTLEDSSPILQAMKISTCTMTGKSLNNLFDETPSSASSEEKAVQTVANDLIQSANLNMKRAISSTSLSSTSAASLPTESHEKKSMKTPSVPLSNQLHQRLIGEQHCTYWVNYLGSTAIKMSDDGLTALPSQAISRLKQSTQYARVLPIIGLNISSRGVEFLKHAKERVVICFHDIKSIHCACQDQDLRYFAYVTREQRLITGFSHGSNSFEQQQQKSLSINADYHHYCHVFVVKSEAMSTEIMLTFGQAFDIAYRLHRRLKKSKEIHSILQDHSPPPPPPVSHPTLEVIRLSNKTDLNHGNGSLMSSSTHSPGSSSSSSMDERKIFV